MCSASMGAEGSVTLQLREAVEAPDSNGQSDATSLTVGYPESDLLNDIQGSIQATGEHNFFFENFTFFMRFFILMRSV